MTAKTVDRQLRLTRRCWRHGTRATISQDADRDIEGTLDEKRYGIRITDALRAQLRTALGLPPAHTWTRLR